MNVKCTDILKKLGMFFFKYSGAQKQLQIPESELIPYNSYIINFFDRFQQSLGMEKAFNL